MDWFEAHDTNTNSLFFGRIQADHVGATRHSASGLSAILAVVREARIRAVSPMAPMDNGGLNMTAHTRVAATAPATGLPEAVAKLEPLLVRDNAAVLSDSQ